MRPPASAPQTLGGKIIVYESLLAFVEGALDTCRNPHQVAQLRLDLKECLSLALYDAVTAIAQSLQVRKVLLEIVSKLSLTNDSNLRAALRTDSERIATLLVTSFRSESEREAILNLSSDLAQCFLDVVQEILGKRLLQDAEHRIARSIVRRLSEASDSLPSSLFIPNAVCTREIYPTFGGGFGDIYRATVGGKPVALKRMRQFLQGSDLRRIHLKFCREALIWKDLKHPHILPLIGIDRDSFPDFMCMVSPWMEHGTVIDYLKKYGHDIVDKLLYEIAQGLQYLHSRNIIHGDLKGANILIQENWTACLADFGLSEFSDASTSMSSNRGGSVYWMAPELLDPHITFARTPAIDIYAFGCVCLELYTGRPPFAKELDIVAATKIIAGERPLRPSSSPAMSDLLWEHVTSYWGQNSTCRPTSRQVVENMRRHISLPLSTDRGDSSDVYGTSSFFPNTTYGITPLHDLPFPSQYTIVKDPDDHQQELHIVEPPSSPLFGGRKQKDQPLQPPTQQQQTTVQTPLHQQVATKNDDDGERELAEQLQQLTPPLPPGVFPPTPSPTAPSLSPYSMTPSKQQLPPQTLHKNRSLVLGSLFSFDRVLSQEHNINISKENIPLPKDKEKKGGLLNRGGGGGAKDKGWKREREREGQPAAAEMEAAGERERDLREQSRSRKEANEERGMDVLAAAAHASGSRKDAGFRGLWRRVKRRDKPEEGAPFHTGDAMLNPPLLSIAASTVSPPPIVKHDATPIVPDTPPVSRPPPEKRKISDKHPGTENNANSKLHRSHQRRRQIVPLDEDIRRLLQECKAGAGNATLLTQALVVATPDQVNDPLIVELRKKCKESQKLIFTQIPWASAGAERSRAAKDQEERECASTQRTSTTAITPRNGSLPDLSRGAATQTREEKLLAELLASNELLVDALKLYDDLKRVARERCVAVDKLLSRIDKMYSIVNHNT